MTLIVGAAAPLGVKDKVGEVLLFGFDAEVVVPDAVPLVVEKTHETDDEDKRQADAETGESNYINYVIFILQGFWKNIRIKH